MPDGDRFFRIPEYDDPPPRRSIHDGLFEGSGQTVDIYLTLPAFRPDRPNVASGDGSSGDNDETPARHADAVTLHVRLPFWTRFRV